MHLSRRSFLAGLAAAPVIAACGGDDEEAATTTTRPRPTTTTTEATTTTPPPPPVAPLTGQVWTGDPAILTRPALVVKIDNADPSARPQYGLNQADIVFEEIVEVQTRFAAVFHSQTADPVGPIRSGRTQDIDLLGSFNAPMFMWSGGNAAVTRAIEDSDLVNLSAQHSDVYAAAGFFRSDDRPGPHDLYASTSASNS